MTARVITTILRLRRVMHPYIVVMTLAVIMLRYPSILRGKKNNWQIVYNLSMYTSHIQALEKMENAFSYIPS